MPDPPLPDIVVRFRPRPGAAWRGLAGVLKRIGRRLGWEVVGYYEVLPPPPPHGVDAAARDLGE